MAAEAKEEQQAPPPRKRSPAKLLVVGLLALILIGGAAAAAVFILRGSPEEVAEENQAEAPPEVGPIYELEVFTVNLHDNSGQRYLRVKINLELADPALVADLDARLPVLRDTVLLLLSSLSLADIDSVEDKEALKETIRQRVEQYLRPGSVRRVLFVDFLVQ